MKIIEQFEQLPKCCQTCKSLLRTIRIPVYHCALKLHFPTAKNTCKRCKMKAQELFKKFLKEKGVYELYCHNFDDKFSNGEDGKIGKKIKGSENFFILAFHWDSTPQGIYFWMKLHKEWLTWID